MQIIDNQHRRVGEWIVERTGGTFSDDCVCIGLERKGEIVAGVLYNMYHGKSIGMHTAIEGRLTREFLWYVFYYPFIQLGVKVIMATMDSANTEVIEFNKHLGFRVEHTIKDAGKIGDLVITTMTKDQCKWLALRITNVGRRKGVGNGQEFSASSTGLSGSSRHNGSGQS